jgi:hypothetical protein
LEVKALYLLIDQDLKIINTVFMPGQRKGKKVYCEQEGKRGTRENLVGGRRKKEKNLMPPVIFKGTLNAVGFEQ